MFYKTEPHLHTSETSSCGKLPAADIIGRYHDAGYKTVFVTDHLMYGFFTNRPELTYTEAIDRFAAGYDAAAEAGAAYGMNIIFGAELQLRCIGNHYLLYGADKEFLKKYPDIFSFTPPQLHDFTKGNGLFLVQAHPNRGHCYPTPGDVDGFEVYNSNPRHLEESDEAAATAEADKYGIPKTSGSDAHRPEDVGRGGIESETEIRSFEDYRNVLLSGNYRIIRPKEES